VDLLAMETIPTIREAEVLVRLLDEFDAVGWLSYQCRDGSSTAAGEPIEAAFAIGSGVAGLVAIGVNCTAPRFLPSLMELAMTVGDDLPRIAYPNGGDAWDAVSRRWVARDTSGAFDAASVATWTDLGATWLGGCCGTTPADIAALTATIQRGAESA
jgi:homocysteine S-methyltransferase